MMAYLTEISLLGLTILIAVLLVRWQFDKNNNFNLTDLLLGEDGKLSLFRFGQAVALITSTWGFVILVQQGKLTEWFFLAYISVWSGVNLTKNIIGKVPADGRTGKSQL